MEIDRAKDIEYSGDFIPEGIEDSPTKEEYNKFPIPGSYRYSKLKPDQLEKIIVMKQSQLDSIIKESIMHGDHLSAQPFIPEYLGFEEDFALHPDGHEQRIYRKDGRIIMRYPSLDESKASSWLVDFQSEIIITNMLQGIIVLESLRFNVNVEKYVKDGGC